MSFWRFAVRPGKSHLVSLLGRSWTERKEKTATSLKKRRVQIFHENIVNNSLFYRSTAGSLTKVLSILFFIKLQCWTLTTELTIKSLQQLQHKLNVEHVALRRQHVLPEHKSRLQACSSSSSLFNPTLSLCCFFLTARENFQIRVPFFKGMDPAHSLPLKTRVGDLL